MDIHQSNDSNHADIDQSQLSRTGELIIGIIVRENFRLFFSFSYSNQIFYFPLYFVLVLFNYYPIEYYWKCDCSNSHLSCSTVTSSDKFYFNVIGYCRFTCHDNRDDTRIYL